MNKICPECGKEFETNNNRRKYCSNSCYNSRLRRGIYNGNYKFRSEIKKLVNHIRVDFDILETYQPQKAIELREQMKKSKDAVFITSALGWKMTYEPLRDKLLKCDAGYKVIDKEYRHLFDIEDVTSAVEGLKQDIGKSFTHSEIAYLGYDKVDRIKELVDEWFPDAIDNDTKERL